MGGGDPKDTKGRCCHPLTVRAGLVAAGSCRGTSKHTGSVGRSAAEGLRKAPRPQQTPSCAHKAPARPRKSLGGSQVPHSQRPALALRCPPSPRGKRLVLGSPSPTQPQPQPRSAAQRRRARGLYTRALLAPRQRPAPRAAPGTCFKLGQHQGSVGRLEGEGSDAVVPPEGPGRCWCRGSHPGGVEALFRSVQPQEESHSQPQGEEEEGWAAAGEAQAGYSSAWSRGLGGLGHLSLPIRFVHLAKGLEKKTRESGITPNWSSTGWKPPESPHLASPGAEERQGHPAAHAAPPQGAQAASSPPARSSRHTQKSLLALGFSQHRKRSELSPQVLALLLARSLKKLSEGSRSWGWSLSLSPLQGSGWGHGSPWAPQQKMWGAGAELGNTRAGSEGQEEEGPPPAGCRKPGRGSWCAECNSEGMVMCGQFPSGTSWHLPP